MGLYSVIGTLVSAMVGSAIFSLSGNTIAASSGFSIISWIIAGVIMLFYALLVSRLSFVFPLSGGLYFFPRSSFSSSPILGSFLGLTSAVGTVLCNIIAIGFTAILIPICLGVGSEYSTLVSILSVLVSFFINISNVSRRGKINTVFAIMLSVLILVYSIILLSSGNFHIANVSNSLSGGLGAFFTKTAKSIPIASLGYGAIVSVSFIAGDVKNPKRNIRLGVAISAFIVIFLYSFSLFSTIGVIGTDSEYLQLPYKSALSVSGVSVFFDIPFKIVMLVALFSTINVMVDISRNTLSAIASDGFLPKIFIDDTKKSSHIISLVAVIFLSVLVIPKGFAFKLISLGAFFSIYTIIINILSYIKVLPKSKNSNAKKVFSYFLLAVLLSSSIASIYSSKDIFYTIIYFTFIVLLLCLLSFFSNIDNISHKLKISSHLPFNIRGCVEHGKALGRTIGMPTANIYPAFEEIVLLNRYIGVYASFVFIGGKKYFAVTNIGPRPTVDDDKTVVVESHILDGFDRDIYGENIDVKIVEFIRPIEKKKSLEEVKAQVEKDKKSAISALMRYAE